MVTNDYMYKIIILQV